MKGYKTLECKECGEERSVGEDAIAVICPDCTQKLVRQVEQGELNNEV